MPPWNQRPREIRNLFNPAFCGLIIVRGIEGYSENMKQSMPFSLSLLTLPLSLHTPTRKVLLNSPKTYFTKIIQEHPEIRVDLAERTKGLIPYTMEAFAYLMACGVIHVDEYGGIILKEKTFRKSIKGTQDTKDCQKAARLLGRKMALINDRVTIYTTLGIRP